MCFTVNINLVKEELEKRYGVDFLDHEQYRPSYYYHAHSLPLLPVVTSDRILLMQWGLIPSWTSSTSQAQTMRRSTFNARAESISEKPAFAESFESRRCILPVSGFYEWQHHAAIKIPWYIYASDNSILSLGCIWSEWTDKESGVVYRTFSIVTTEANNLLSVIHNSARRMPLVIAREDVDNWISGNQMTCEKLMHPAPEEALSAHTISSIISSRSANKNTPEITKPYQYYITGSLF